ncbi:hypothetical protein F511_38470 [Dorcoceras hygrometricum]|uniref:Uncharacterized protein n=1 Tax=Dorcoceras hygrometricum TaxID=472368 RepID=A0A2Z7D904_9LAMI|nr:hypothetical protein F511_38470 [Dorcoceras hygrometricum]
MDLLSLPMSERLNLDGKKKAEYVRTLHEKVRANIEKKIQQYTTLLQGFLHLRLYMVLTH